MSHFHFRIAICSVKVKAKDLVFSPLWLTSLSASIVEKRIFRTFPNVLINISHQTTIKVCCTLYYVIFNYFINLFLGFILFKL